MSPDLDWQVDRSSGQETVAQTPPPSKSRWRKICVILMIFLGIGLGIAYRSLVIASPPASLPKPISTRETSALPEQLPASETSALTTQRPRLEDTIDGEALALAHGNLRDFMAIQDPNDPQWQEHQMSPEVFNAWGLPSTGALYTIVETGTLSDDRVWVSVAQFRDGRHFYETRFYQLQNNHWVRTAMPAVDQSFWGKPQTIDQGHFKITFYDKDASLAKIVAAQFEAAYQRVCNDLHCVDSSGTSLLGKTKVWLTLVNVAVSPDQSASFSLPPPRISGIYLADPDDPSGQEDPTKATAYKTLTYDFAQCIAGNPGYAVSPSGSNGLATAISEWKLVRLGVTNYSSWQMLQSSDLAPLESVLYGRGWYPTPEASALIEFIDEQYGADKVVELLHALRSTSTLPDAIKSIGLPYTEFKQSWTVWSEQLVKSHSG